VGATGPTGANGTNGTNGTNGATGATGATGAANGLVVGSAGTTSFGAAPGNAPNASCFFAGIGSSVSVAATCGTAELTQFPMPVTGAIKSFYVSTPGIGGNPQKVTFSIRINGTPSGTATCVGTATGCSVTGINVAVTAGQLIDITISGNAGSAPTVGTLTWGFQYQ
jgi:hypothetical protein